MQHGPTSIDHSHNRCIIAACMSRCVTDVSPHTCGIFSTSWSLELFDFGSQHFSSARGKKHDAAARYIKAASQCSAGPYMFNIYTPRDKVCRQQGVSAAPCCSGYYGGKHAVAGASCRTFPLSMLVLPVSDCIGIMCGYPWGLLACTFMVQWSIMLQA